jgi:hypothetical protein
MESKMFATICIISNFKLAVEAEFSNTHIENTFLDLLFWFVY